MPVRSSFSSLVSMVAAHTAPPIRRGMHCNHPVLVAAGSGADTFQHLSIAQL
jgi:hypothetical protein